MFTLPLRLAAAHVPVKTTGRIEYTVILSVGYKAIEAHNNNTLHFDFGQASVTSISCSIDSSTTVPVGRPLTTDLGYGSDVACKFLLLADQSEKIGSQISAVHVRAMITGEDVTREFYITPVATPPLAVAVMMSPQGAGLFTTAASGSNYYENGEYFCSVCGFCCSQSRLVCDPMG